jgi:hypothetical protein
MCIGMFGKHQIKIKLTEAHKVKKGRISKNEDSRNQGASPLQ